MNNKEIHYEIELVEVIDRSRSARGVRFHKNCFCVMTVGASFFRGAVSQNRRVESMHILLYYC